MFRYPFARLAPRVLAIAICLLLTACATSGPTISATRSPGADLAQFTTFNYLPRLGTDRATGARTPLSNQLIEAMNREMTARGLSLSDTPELLVDFSFLSREGIQVSQTPNAGTTTRRSHWGRTYSVWPGYSTTVRQYTEGALLIDLIDVENASLIGEGVAQGRSLGDIRALSQEDIDGLVADIMAQLAP